MLKNSKTWLFQVSLSTISLSFSPYFFLTEHLSMFDWRGLWLLLHVSKYSCQVEWLITQSAPPLPPSPCVIWQRRHKVFLDWASGLGTDVKWSMSTAIITLVPWWLTTTAVTVTHLQTLQMLLPAGCYDPVMTATTRTQKESSHSYIKSIWIKAWVCSGANTDTFCR